MVRKHFVLIDSTPLPFSSAKPLLTQVQHNSQFTVTFFQMQLTGSIPQCPNIA
jgi:hypothetical protein